MKLIILNLTLQVLLTLHTYCNSNDKPISKIKSEIIIGIEQKENLNGLSNKRIGLLTNNASRIKSKSTADFLATKSKLDITALYVPEHGFYTSVKAGDHVENDVLFGIPVYSLYGKYRRPTKEYLAKCDVILVDIQDIGVRSYTYISTVFNMLDACAEFGKKVIIVDRPNPLSMRIVDGNVAEKEKLNFVSKLPVPYLHGMTIGELCYMINEEGWLPANRKCDLEVLPFTNYNKISKLIYEQNWIPTSPHVPSVNAVRGAATIGAIGELGMISIGIGTTSPFQYIGAPDFDIAKFLDALKQNYQGYFLDNESFIQIEGVKLILTKYQPFYGMYSGKECNGFYLQFDESRGEYFTAGIAILFALKVSHPQFFEKISDRGKNMFKKVTGTDKLWNSLESNSPYIFKNLESCLKEFKELRAKYLLYDR